MDSLDYDDPVVEEEWCAARRAQVIDYLEREKVHHGEVGEWPAWHVTPYVSVWAIESLVKPGWVGWWVICGDLPTDYVSADTIKHPREALKEISQRWQEASEYMARGEEHPTISIGAPEDWQMLGPQLRARAGILRDWASDTGLWGE